MKKKNIGCYCKTFEYYSTNFVFKSQISYTWITIYIEYNVLIGYFLEY